MLSASCLAHIEGDELERSGLCSGPVYTSRRFVVGNGSHVDDKVAYLTVKDIGGSEFKCTIRTISITVDQTESVSTREVCRGLDYGYAVRITNELSVVVVDDGRGNDISSCREVDDGGCSSA